MKDTLMQVVIPNQVLGGERTLLGGHQREWLGRCATIDQRRSKRGTDTEGSMLFVKILMNCQIHMDHAGNTINKCLDQRAGSVRVLLPHLQLLSVVQKPPA
ncbi:hypothetical protein IF1G_05332 [Cordyceps javanica]|uniref:Uncharacterized protein n=1 Tax=Cordyceps javanica TaxID=43265 RepID=A0A545V1E8_9HYPO|nr:hypothetical protein IF1G_05332 [Cordyceps javanica]